MNPLLVCSAIVILKSHPHCMCRTAISSTDDWRVFWDTLPLANCLSQSGFSTPDAFLPCFLSASEFIDRMLVFPCHAVEGLNALRLH